MSSIGTNRQTTWSPASQAEQGQASGRTIADWMAEQRAASAGVSEGSDSTAMGETVRRGFATVEFLEAGAAHGVWFTVPAEFREKFIAFAEESGEDGKSMLRDLDRVMGQLNAFLARTDVSAELKQKFLADMFGRSSDSYDGGPGDVDATGKNADYLMLGTVLSELVSGNGKILFRVDDLDAETVSSMCASFGPAMSTWLKDNEVSIKPDTSREYFRGLASVGDEARARYKNMTIEEIAADVMASRARARAEREAKRNARPGVA